MSHLRGISQLPNRASPESSHDLPAQRLSIQTSNAAGAAAQPSSSQIASSHSAHRIRRRNRIITSCLECRRRKLKCDKLHPCTNCTKFVRDCVFLAPALNSASQLKLVEIKEKMGRLERGLAAEVANAKEKQRLQSNRGEASGENENPEPDAQHNGKVGIDLPGELSPEQSDDDGNFDALEDEKGLEPTPLAVLDAAYEDAEEDADDDMLDLGVKMGKLRMTQRIGGYLRPKMTEALSCQLNLPRTESQSQEEQSSSAPLISPSTSPHFQPAWQDEESFLEPGPTYIAPGSGLLFGNTGNPGRHTPIFDFLPSRLAGDRLIKQYHDAAHFIARAIHWPSFQTQYDRFWANITAGIEPSGCLQALVFAVMFSATVSMNEAEVVELFSVPKSKLVAGFQTATEAGLAKANFLRTTKIETLQALVIYLIPMCRSEMSRAHAVLVGTAIRIAECMGLHRDPEQAFGLGPLESHVRRILWFQLCFLDIRTTEAQAPRPLIKRDDFDSAFPLNINDADLISGNPGESNGWTDMTFSKIRFECNEMHRVIWLDRLRLEKKQIGLTHVLGKIESFRKAMETKYHPIIDETVPLQKEAKLVMNLLLLKMHIMVLHRYHTSDVPIPDRLRHVTLSSEIQMMEDAIRLETNVVLQPWAWYCGTYQQWHTALLLLMEVFSFPMRQEADRIWRVLDYVFETDPSMERQQKSRAIISEIRDRTAASKDFRKIRAPISMLPIYNTFTRRPANGQSTDVELDFNSDPAPLVSRVVHHPLQTGRTSSERDCEPGSYPGAAEPTHKPGPQSQGSSQSPSQSSQRLNSVTAVRLAEMTKAYADAPSPMSPIDPPHEQSWTFDAPSNYYVGMHRTAYPKKANSKQTTQNTAPTTATINPDGHMNPSVRLEPGQPQKTYAWSGEVSAGNRAYANNAPQGLDVGAMPLDLLSATGNAVGDSTKMRGGLGETGVSEMEPDLMMIDIDWNEWDKIFPPESNTGILNTPTPHV